MKSIKTLIIIFCLSGLLASQLFRTMAAEEETTRQAMVILRDSCLQCHGEDRMAGLDLRTREAALRGGGRGAALVPGKSAESLLVRYIEGKISPKMPLGGELTREQIAVLTKWVDDGAAWADLTARPAPTVSAEAGRSKITAADRAYWAFRPPVTPEVPRVAKAGWALNPIDNFTLVAMEERGLAPSKEADKRTLLRRVTFDLTGLPPTPEETAAFLADRSPQAYEKVVERLLASPRYGERWAQHWLDVVRFGETNGFELDQDRDQAWRYRDYVVRAFNEDKPYDRFIREQIAGDETDPESFEMRVATGFLRAGPQHVVAGNQDPAINRQEWLTEVMFGVGNGILGLTVGCARCHDHKFDPILQADFYRLQAFFAGADNHDYQKLTNEQEASFKAAKEAHDLKLKPIKEQLATIEKPYQERLKAEKRSHLEPRFAAALNKPADQRSEEEKQTAKDAQRMLNVAWEELVAALTPEDRQKRAALRQQMHRLNLFTPEPLPKAPGVSDKIWPVPTTHILKAGDPNRPAAEVRPGFLTALLPPDAAWDASPVPIEKGEFKATGRRLALADWLTRPEHPLTSRVMVNRLWHYHFGRGIVATPNDFGRNGQPPTHPRLLDWLATEFVRRGWSIREMNRLMVLSRTYRQSSATDPVRAAIDPENKLLWRMNRLRLDAEALRDATLAVAGNLTEQFGGPPVRVPLDPEVYDTIFTEAEPDNLWPVHPDTRQHNRRSLYLLRKRNVRLPMFVAFDSPDMMSSCGARSVSVHALQSLTLLNSRYMFDQSRIFAARLLREAGGDQSRAVGRLYQLTLGRPPRPDEARLAADFLAAQTRVIEERRLKGESIATLPEPLPSVSPATAAAWVDLCLATMNLNEFIYLR